MTKNQESGELLAQLAEYQRIVSAQADDIDGLRKELANCHSHNQLMVLRAKKAEEEVVEIRDSAKRWDARALPCVWPNCTCESPSTDGCGNTPSADGLAQHEGEKE